MNKATLHRLQRHFVEARNEAGDLGDYFRYNRLSIAARRIRAYLDGLNIHKVIYLESLIRDPYQ